MWAAVVEDFGAWGVGLTASTTLRSHVEPVLCCNFGPAWLLQAPTHLFTMESTPIATSTYLTKATTRTWYAHAHTRTRAHAHAF